MTERNLNGKYDVGKIRIAKSEVDRIIGVKIE